MQHACFNSFSWMFTWPESKDKTDREAPPSLLMYEYKTVTM